MHGGCVYIKEQVSETVLSFLFWIPPHPSSSPMWRCPSCLSMRWTSLTRCQDTCWTWMTHQAPWQPWQRLSWLDVSLGLVVSLAGAALIKKKKWRGDGSAHYLQADLFPAHSNHWRSTTSPSTWKYLRYAPLSVPLFISEHAALSWEVFLWRQTGRWISEAVMKLEFMSSWKRLQSSFLLNIFKELCCVLFLIHYLSKRGVRGVVLAEYDLFL